MPTAPAPHPLYPDRYATPLLLASIVAGMAFNYFYSLVFLNIEFLFGGVFAMLALQVLGWGRGVIAAAPIASITWLLWNHPYAMVTMTAEVMVAGGLFYRCRMGLVLAVALYWLVIGMPLAYLAFYGVMGTTQDLAMIIMAKQAVNGIANALLARLLLTGLVLGSRRFSIAYRDLVYNLLALFALWPALGLLAIAARNDFAETDDRIRTTLRQQSQRVTEQLATWVQERTTTITHLAKIAAMHPPHQTQLHLELARQTDPHFQRIGLLDEAATVTAFSPPTDDQNQTVIGRSFADRPYLPVLRQTLEPMLSEMVIARIGPPQPITMVLAPVVSDGAFSGYLGGALSLEHVRGHLADSVQDTTLRYTLLDKNGHIILSNRPDQTTMTPLMRGPGTVQRLDHGIAMWAPPLPAHITVMERWRASLYFIETPVGTLAEWRLVLEQPLAPFQEALYARYARALLLLLGILFTALALAEFLSRKIVAALEQLSELTDRLPALMAANQRIHWPTSALLEPRRLIERFQAMTAALTAQQRANQELNATLEQQIQDRTATLRRSEADLKRSNTDLEQFAYAASHDLRQPLRMISSYLQLLEADLQPALNDETRQHLRFAIDGAQRLDQMLAALLDYSRIGRKTDLMAQIDSRDVLDEALRYLQPAIAEAQADLCSGGEWPLLFASRDELLRLVQNLIDNALKYRLEGRKPEITVSAQIVGDEWHLTVRDNGIGLAVGQEGRLFKVFERLQPRDRYPGTGIGLALCRKIVEHHCGTIMVESAGENQGCTFTVTLPMTGLKSREQQT